MADDDDFDALAKLQTTVIRPLPEFPCRQAADPATLAASFGWAQCLLNVRGTDAPYYALNAILIAIQQQDAVQLRGWRNISDAMAELSRMPGIGDPVH